MNLEIIVEVSLNIDQTTNKCIWLLWGQVWSYATSSLPLVLLCSHEVVRCGWRRGRPSGALCLSVAGSSWGIDSPSSPCSWFLTIFPCHRSLSTAASRTPRCKSLALKSEPSWPAQSLPTQMLPHQIFLSPCNGQGNWFYRWSRIAPWPSLWFASLPQWITRLANESTCSFFLTVPALLSISNMYSVG